jgi:hypothetical protein
MRASLRPVRRKVPAIVSAAFVLALMTATSAGAGSLISLPAYAKRADAVCADYHRKTAKLPHVQLSNFPGVAKLARTALVIVTADNKRLRAIPLPSTKRTLVERWLRRGYRVPALLRALRHAAQLENLTKVLTADEALQTNGAKRRALARRLGMCSCTRR